MPRGKLIALYAYVRREEMSEINNLSSALGNFKKKRRVNLEDWKEGNHKNNDKSMNSKQIQQGLPWWHNG